MATDTNTGFEVKDMAKVWKEWYLKGLEAFLQWQQQNEQLVKQAVRQGFSAYHQWLGMYKNLLRQPWDQVQGQSTGVPEAKSKVLGESIKHHVKEEDSMLPKAEKLVLDWEALKQKVLTRKKAVIGRKSKSTSRSPMRRKINRSKGRNTQRRRLRKAA